MIQMQVSYW